MGQIFHFLLCIASWHTYLNLLKLNKATLGELKQRKQTFHKPPHQMQLLNLTNKSFLDFQIVLGSSKSTFYNKFSKSKYCQIRNKFENPKLVQSKSYFETKLSFPKIQNKIMGSFIIIVGASMNKFIIFGNT